MSLIIEQYGLIEYEQAYERQLALVDRLRNNSGDPVICMLLEHPPVFTIGRNGSVQNVGVSEQFLENKNIRLMKIERGGEVTYHGPGQIVCYPLVNLRSRGLRVADFIFMLEQIMLEVVRAFGIEAGRDPRNHGIWIGDRKLGSVGIAIRHGISFHGLALNVDLDLSPFSWIHPCGLAEVSMTSMAEELGDEIDSGMVEAQMIEAIGTVFKEQATVVRQKKNGMKRQPKPKWLKQRLPQGGAYERTRNLVSRCSLNTVCREARCPNQFECYGKGTATFMIMGDQCTRNCGFCAVSHAGVSPLDAEEPDRVARAVREMDLAYVVVTSVTRDDLSDGGASHFGATIEAVNRRCPGVPVEVLIPDFRGDRDALKVVCSYRPAVLNHNVETVARLYPEVRPQAVYRRSLDLLVEVKRIDSSIKTKSGLMVGLGETFDELVETMEDIRSTGCDLLTVGQYLQPTPNHLPVTRFYPPEEFETLKQSALDMGFAGVASGPHVRSSYRADLLYRQA